jgi:hypothetical protein
MEHPDPKTIDARPTLVVEFPPQHIFEESLFKPAGTDLPEVALPPTLTQFSVPLQEFSVDVQKAKAHDPLAFVYSTAPARLLSALDDLPDLQDRRVVRTHYSALKIKQENSDDGPFTKLSKKLADQFNKDPSRYLAIADQFVYIGPYGMDADVSAVARKDMSEIQGPLIAKIIAKTLGDAAYIAEKLNNPDIPVDQDSGANTSAVTAVSLMARTPLYKGRTRSPLSFQIMPFFVISTAWS